MFIVGDTIVSEDFADHCFACNIPKCKGACCLQGDAGAPLDEDELHILDEILPVVKPYMTEQGIKSTDEHGTWIKTINGDLVTPLAESLECAYAYFDNGTVLCAIEKAWLEGLISFRKPISCHLYPARLTDFKDFTAVNYHQWHVCIDAIENGEQKKIKLYEFLKEPLIRKFGEAWYKELCEAISEGDRK